MHDNEDRRIREVIDAVLARLIAQDVELLVLDVHERTITAKLADYMQDLLPGWTVTLNTTAFVVELRKFGWMENGSSSSQTSSLTEETAVTTFSSLKQRKSGTLRISPERGTR
jgi:hypothetical protein